MVVSRPLICTLLFFVLLSVCFAVDDIRALIVFGLLNVCVWFLIAAWSLFTTIRLFRRRAWLQAVIWLIVPIATPFAAFELREYTQIPLDYLHFEFLKDSYDREIAQEPADGQRYAEFYWGGMLFLGRGVVYDESDEIALPYGHQSTRWKRRVGSDLICDGNGPIGLHRHLEGHYYVATFGC